MEQLSNKIESRLQFVITILTFFLFVFSPPLLAGCAVVVGYIIVYLVFSILNERFNEKQLQIINNFILIGIGAFIIPLTVFAMADLSITIQLWGEIALKGLILISLIPMIYIPAILFAYILWYGVEWKKILFMEIDR